MIDKINLVLGTPAVSKLTRIPAPLNTLINLMYFLAGIIVAASKSAIPGVTKLTTRSRYFLISAFGQICL